MDVARFTPAQINRAILSLAVPAVLENLLGTAVFMVDTALIGRLNDSAALAAAGISSSFLNIAQSLFMALGIGALALVARAYGSGDSVRARRLGAQAISVSLILAVLLTAVMIPLTRPFLTNMLRITDPVVIDQGTIYVQTILTTSFLALPAITSANVMRACGDTRTPMMITLGVNVVNIVLASILIFGAGPIPALHIRGAGLATAIARGLGGLLSLWVLGRGLARVKINLADLRVWHWPDVAQLWRLAWPNLLEQVIQRTGFIAFTGIVATLGTAAMAAHNIADAVESLAFMPAWGFAIAAASLVGQSLGAQRVDIAKLTMRRSAVFTGLTMSVFFVGFVAFPRALASIFGGQGEVIDLASVAVRISALELFGLAFYMLYGSALRGAGDTRSPMLVSLIGVICFRVTAVWLLAIVLQLGLAGVWLGTAIDWAGRGIIMYIMYRRGRWAMRV